MKKHLRIAGTVALIGLTGCAATESSRVIETAPPSYTNLAPAAQKETLVIGSFQNRSNYLRGIFSDGTDKLGNQAKTVLKAHLNSSQSFTVVDRENLERLRKEAAFSGTEVAVKGAKYVVSGDVTEFGRKNVGDKQFFGIIGKGKTQIAYSKVTLNIVDVATTEIVYSTTGTGEYSLSTREVIGFGSDASYDATLNGKVLDLSISEAVTNLVQGIENGSWKLK